MKHRNVALFLAAVLLTSVFASCGDSKKPVAETNNKQNAAVTDSVTEVPRIAADLPDRDFGGETLTFYGRIYGGAWSASDLLSHTQDGEQINDALYDRTTH
ncbi:MAG: hypothetical protein MJ175_10675, partial [Clostridia bacterium]|nr:hypothetical protein [Clostridia bacterium]